MINASICTIGDEILIGQIVDTNSAHISRFLNSLGIKVTEIVSISDDKQVIINQLNNSLLNNDIVITTGGLGPTKDDITKSALATLSGSTRYIENSEQKAIMTTILRSRGLDTLDANLQQAMVPETCRVILNKLGTAPIMEFEFDHSRFGHDTILFSLPGVPFEALAALPDIGNEIKRKFKLDYIFHKTIMTYGLAESALSKLIEPWEVNLPKDMHLAYLPNTLTGVRLRLSVYGGDENSQKERVTNEFDKLKDILGDYIYSDEDDNLANAVGKLLKGTGKTLCAAESCTGGMISHMLTCIPGSSEYYLGSVTSYAIPVKEKILGVKDETIRSFGIVSSEVASEMAEGVRTLMGATYSVATTGWADKYGDEREPAGTVWVAISGPAGTVSMKFQYKNDRERNIERFAASAINELRKYILSDK